MQRFSGIWGGAGGVICGALLLVLSGLVGCGPEPEVVAEQKREEQWQAVEQAKSELTAKRQELAAARQAASEAAASEAVAEDAAEGDGDTEAADPRQDVAALEAEVAEETQTFSTLLVEFINANAPPQGEEPPEQIGKAIRMKSDEDVLVAQEFIDRGGDYRRAVEIYEMALAADPDYERLHELKAEAESMRFMTEERFAEVEKGMTRDQVRELLGPVNLRNIRDYEEKNSIAWFYPKDERGSAAAVWFQQSGGSEYKVYQSDFNFKNAGEDEG